MPLKLQSHDEGVWYDFESGARFKIRPFSPVVAAEMRAKLRQLVPVPLGEGASTIAGYVDPGRLSWEIFDYVLMDFEGVEVEGKKEKADLKKALFNFQPAVDFITEKSNELFTIITGKKEDERKNSGSSQDG